MNKQECKYCNHSESRESDFIGGYYCLLEKGLVKKKEENNGICESYDGWFYK